MIDTRASLVEHAHQRIAHQANKLVSIGNVQLPLTQGSRNVVGYPLFGIWDRPYTYNDANGDGVIVPSEITLAAADSFRGSTLPAYEGGAVEHLRLPEQSPARLEPRRLSRQVLEHVHDRLEPLRLGARTARRST